MRFRVAKCALSVLPFSFVVIAGLLLNCYFVNGVLRLPEFTEPIKNVTLPVGSDVEFSCDVRHLGTYRVAWVWNKDEDQRFLSIGIVKITSNSRVHITRLQKSDDVTQFNLYIYNIKKEDIGTYQCSVNSNPMIAQIGTLDVTGENVDDGGETIVDSSLTSDFNLSFRESSSQPQAKDEMKKVSLSRNKSENTATHNPCQHGNESSPCGEINNESGSSENLEEIASNEDNSTSNGGLSQNSTFFCIDLDSVWDNTRERVSSFFSQLMKFAYSYWLS